MSRSTQSIRQLIQFLKLGGPSYGCAPGSIPCTLTGPGALVSRAAQLEHFSCALRTGASTSRGFATRALSWKRTLKGALRDYKQLSKAKLSALVAFTASAGFVAGSGEHIDWAGLGWTSLGTFAAAACANTLNQVYEVHNDALMTRTCNRPLPAMRMSRTHAIAFAAVVGSFGLWLLSQKVWWAA